MVAKRILLSLLGTLVFATSAAAQDNAAFERKVDETIRSACHGFMVDALPDAVSWLREEIYENSPFCKRVLNAGDLEAFGEAVRDAYVRLGPGDVRLDRTQREDRDLNVTIECDSEYMCMEVRLKFQDTPNPVGQQAYDAVRAYCDGRYGCIQAYFLQWPAPLPEPTPIADTAMTRFAEVIAPPQVPEAAPSMAEADIDAAREAAPESDVAAAMTSSTPADPALVGRIETLNAGLRRACACSLSGAPCFDNPYGPVTAHIEQVEGQRLARCVAWDGLMAKPPQADAAAADRLQGIRDAVGDADERGARIIALAAEDFRRIQDRVARGQPFVDTLEIDRIEALAAEPARTEATDMAAAAPGRALDAAPEAATPPADALFVMGPRQGWREATAYCRSLGRRLPTVAEARELRTEIPDEDWWYGLWTSEESYVDAYVQRYKTMRASGLPDAESRTWEARVACVK